METVWGRKFLPQAVFLVPVCAMCEQKQEHVSLYSGMRFYTCNQSVFLL